MDHDKNNEDVKSKLINMRKRVKMVKFKFQSHQLINIVGQWILAIRVESLQYHHHPIQYIPLKEKLLPGSGEGKTTITHTHKEERGQRSLRLEDLQ